jgi:hypothetical protein
MLAVAATLLLSGSFLVLRAVILADAPDLEAAARAEPRAEREHRRAA